MMTKEITTNESEYITGIVEHYHSVMAAKVRERKEYVKNLAARARRGERIGRDAMSRAKHALSEVTFVYFIVCGSGRAVKIGKAHDVESRLAALQVANHEELKLIASFAAPEEVERLLHGVLAEYRIRGEWFTCSDDVLNVAEAAVDGGIDRVFSVISNMSRSKAA